MLVIHLKEIGLSLSKAHRHCQYYMYIVSIAKIADSRQIIAFNTLFVLHYSINYTHWSYSGILYQIDIKHVKCDNYR